MASGVNQKATVISHGCQPLARTPSGEYVIGRRHVVAALGIVVPTLKRDRARLVAALQVSAQGIGRVLTEQRAAVGST